MFNFTNENRFKTTKTMSTAQILYDQYKVLPKKLRKELKQLINNGDEDEVFDDISMNAIKGALEDVKLLRVGKLKTRPIADLLKELADEKNLILNHFLSLIMNLGGYQKKYKTLTTELIELSAQLALNPKQGANLGGGLYKIRLASKSKSGVKSGGFRVNGKQTNSFLEKEVIFREEVSKIQNILL